MKRGHEKQLTVCLCLILLNLSFIWGNSLLPGPQSAEVSGGIMELLEELLESVAPNGEHLIRKLAHFSEFACLGLLFAWLFQILGQSRFHVFTMPLLFGSMAALVDETLQVLTPERGPSVVDVWIDIAGVTTGILLLLLGLCLWQTRKSKSNGGNKT